MVTSCPIPKTLITVSILYLRQSRKTNILDCLGTGPTLPAYARDTKSSTRKLHTSGGNSLAQTPRQTPLPITPRSQVVSDALTRPLDHIPVSVYCGFTVYTVSVYCVFFVNWVHSHLCTFLYVAYGIHYDMCAFDPAIFYFFNRRATHNIKLSWFFKVIFLDWAYLELFCVA